MVQWAKAQRIYIGAARKAAPHAQRVIRGFLARRMVRQMRTVNSIAKLQGTYAPNSKSLAVLAAGEFRRQVVDSAIKRSVEASRPLQKWIHRYTPCSAPVLPAGTMMANAITQSVREISAPSLAGNNCGRLRSLGSTPPFVDVRERKSQLAYLRLWESCQQGT